MTEPTMKEVQEHFLSLLDDNHRRHWEYRIVHPKLPLPGTRQAQENAAMTKWETQAKIGRASCRERVSSPV